ncbi:spermidine synthase [Haloglomus halophilum]|uniref:spermidine synthase n=1 Tax=Haloglomus halophilum TaxID=2962672 RepID=UPI0020C9CB44|nr:fused MFS/spermidine synthase [Haloglomus halophilum]
MSTVRGRLPVVTDAGAAVFVSGVASMGLEILSGRIIAPQYGSSIYTWGTIIGVFLAALSLGYHRGGQRAAEHASTDRMAWALMATAGYVAAIIFAGDLMLAAVAGLPLPARFASLPAVTLLFGPPTYLLGYISPYAAELAEADGVGQASGHVYAVGTVGSILGAFGTTFLLIPTLSVEYIGLVFGILLVGTAVYLSYPPLSGMTARSLAVAVLLVLAATSGSFGFAVEGRVLYETQTPYQELEVTQINDTRTLYLDDQQHSAMDVDRPTRHVFEYTRYFHLPYLLADDPDDIDRVLFIGGGGFTGPKRFVEEYDATVDVVEIDPEVIDVAKEYFAVEESDQLNIYQGDGRRYLRETNRTYDLIVLDAYKKDKVPFQLTTVEFFELAESQLSADGMLYANVISAESGPASKFYRAEYRTMSEVFPQVYTFPTVGGSIVQNIQLVATRNDTRVSEAALRAREERRDIGIDLSFEVRNLREEPPPTDDVPVLRDDRAPVDSLLDPMVGQRYVVQETTRNGTSTASPAIEPPARSPTATVGARTVPLPTDRTGPAARVSGV